MDDGRRGLVTMYCSGYEAWAPRKPPGANPYHSVSRGDVVRMTVATHSGYVLAVRPIAAADGGPPPSTGVLPAVPAGAPLSVDQVSGGTGAAVRRVAHHLAGGATCVDVFVYHLVEDTPSKLEVFVVRGRTPVDAIRSVTGAGDPEGTPSGRPEHPTVRYQGGLLIGSSDDLAVGIRPPSRLTAPGVPWPSDVHLLDEALRTVLTR